ncbi:MAG: hypothetical protein ACU85V_03395 [Gammaproteobacteria bacterium]
MSRAAPWLYLLLLAAAVPWYWSDAVPRLVLGVPAWVATAIGVSLGASVLTAVLLARPWPGESDDDD